MNLDTVSVTRAHGGTQHVVSHRSRATGTDMTFSVFVPPQADDGRPGVAVAHLVATERLAKFRCTFEREPCA